MTFIGLKAETVSNKPIEKPVEVSAETAEEQSAEELPAEGKPSTKGGGKK